MTRIKREKKKRKTREPIERSLGGRCFCQWETHELGRNVKAPPSIPKRRKKETPGKGENRKRGRSEIEVGGMGKALSGACDEKPKRKGGKRGDQNEKKR